MSAPAQLPCPTCGMRIEAEARTCVRCGRGIATIVLRAQIHGELRRYMQRVACHPDDVEFIDGQEAELDNPEELPGRES